MSKLLSGIILTASGKIFIPFFTLVTIGIIISVLL